MWIIWTLLIIFIGIPLAIGIITLLVNLLKLAIQTVAWLALFIFGLLVWVPFFALTRITIWCWCKIKGREMPTLPHWTVEIGPHWITFG